MTCVQISIQGITTMETNKRRTFTRTQQSTARADLGSIVRLNLNKFNSFNFCFIFDKLLKLVKTPIGNPIVHLPTSSDFSDSFQIFHYDFVSSETGNYFLADVVINPTHETIFSSRKFFQKSSTGMSAFVLKFTSQEFEFSFGLFDFGGFEELFIGCNGEIINSQVHPKNLILQVRVNGAFSGECEKEIADSFFINHQQTFRNFPSEIFFIAIRNLKRNLNSAFNSGDAQNIIFEGSRTGEVVSNRNSVDNWIRFCFLNHTTRLFDTSNSNLGWKGFSQFGINKGMQLNIISNLHTPSNINTILKSLFIQLNSFDNLFSWFNFDFSGYPDLHKDLRNSTYLNISEGSIPPTLKSMGILEQII